MSDGNLSAVKSTTVQHVTLRSANAKYTNPKDTVLDNASCTMVKIKLHSPTKIKNRLGSHQKVSHADHGKQGKGYSHLNKAFS